MAIVISKESAAEIISVHLNDWHRVDKFDKEKDLACHDYYDRHDNHKLRVARSGDDFVCQVI